MTAFLDDLYNMAVEQKPCPYLHTPEYRALSTAWNSLYDPIEATLGEAFLERLCDIHSDLTFYEFQQNFLAGLKVGLELGRL